MFQIDLYKICQIAAIVQINLASMIFKNSNVGPCQIAAIVHFRDLVWQNARDKIVLVKIVSYYNKLFTS